MATAERVTEKMTINLYTKISATNWV